MTTDRITVLNPNTGRENGTIAGHLYRAVRAAILGSIDKHDGIRFADLRAEVEARTDTELWSNASPGWYTTTVKLDLEARGLLSRSGSPQRLHLTDDGRAALTETGCPDGKSDGSRRHPNRAATGSVPPSNPVPGTGG